jgi:hypothetical protein
MNIQVTSTIKYVIKLDIISNVCSDCGFVDLKKLLENNNNQFIAD